MTGVPERFQPANLLPLLKHNAGYVFDVVYALGAPTKLAYSTEPEVRYNASPFAEYNEAESKRRVELIYGDLATVHFLDFVPDLPKHELVNKLGKLDRITSYMELQEKIMNMYNHQEKCGHTISQLAKSRGREFDYIISTREDVYFFQPLSLDVILQGRRDCGIITKGCLAWKGLNMRLQVLSSNVGEKWLTTRFEHYRYLHQKGIRVWNSESFEKSHAEAMGMKMCSVPVDIFPVAVSRYMGPGQICLIAKEYHFVTKNRLREDCTPSDSGVQKFVKENTCPGSKLI